MKTLVARHGPRERAWQGIKSVLTRAKLLKSGHWGLAEESVRRSLAFSGAVYTALIASWLLLKRLHFCQVDAAFAAMKATWVRSTISFRANYTTAQKNGRKNRLV
jgi:hypothetical protein